MDQSLQQIDLNSPAWLSFVASNPAATIFHHPAWANMLAECYGIRTAGLVLNDCGTPVAGLPFLVVPDKITKQRYVSLPFTDNCPALTQDEAALKDLTRLLAQLQVRDGISAVEIRAPLPECERVYPYSYAVLHTLALSSGLDTVYKGFKRSQVRQNISRAVKEGVVVRRGESLDDMELFYKLHLGTRQRVGAPVQPRRFFELLWKRLIEPGLGFVLLAYKGSTPLASSVFLTWNGTVTYKYSASDAAFWDLRANQLVLWTAIQWACEHGYHTIDFGRTDLDNQGLRDYKNNWGAREEPLVYTIISNHPPKPHNNGLLRWMGLVIRHSPPVVCRAIGELMYKYAA